MRRPSLSLLSLGELRADPRVTTLTSRNDILSVELLNVDSALANFSSPEPIVNLTMRLDARGHLATANAVLVSNATEEASGGVAGAFKGLFGKKDKEDKESEEDAESKDVKTKEKKKVEKVALRFREHHLGVKPASGEEKRKIMAR